MWLMLQGLASITWLWVLRLLQFLVTVPFVNEGEPHAVQQTVQPTNTATHKTGGGMAEHSTH
jgi:hypothetical protein